jgi:hypothetical protein
MNRLRWIVALFSFAAFAAVSFAQSTPPDGQIGVKQSIHSTPITSLSGTLLFSPCAGSTGDIALECAEFSGGAQYVFGGINETGVAWNSLNITLSGLTGPDSVGCAVSDVFANNNCPVPIPSGTDQSVTVNFSQGTGTGVGCINTVTPSDPKNATCIVNSTLAAASNALLGTSLPYDSFIFPQQATGPCAQTFPAGAVCGTDDFVIGVGIGTQTFPTFNPLVSFAANTPEPQTLFMVGGAMIAMLLLGLRKTRLV